MVAKSFAAFSQSSCENPFGLRQKRADRSLCVGLNVRYVDVSVRKTPAKMRVRNISRHGSVPHSRPKAVSNKPSGKKSGLPKGGHVQGVNQKTTGGWTFSHREMALNWPFSSTASIIFAGPSGHRILAGGFLAWSPACVGE
jgi:hypothetical protein